MPQDTGAEPRTPQGGAYPTMSVKTPMPAAALPSDDGSRSISVPEVPASAGGLHDAPVYRAVPKDTGGWEVYARTSDNPEAQFFGDVNVADADRIMAERGSYDDLTKTWDVPEDVAKSLTSGRLSFPDYLIAKYKTGEAGIVRSMVGRKFLDGTMTPEEASERGGDGLIKVQLGEAPNFAWQGGFAPMVLDAVKHPIEAFRFAAGEAAEQMPIMKGAVLAAIKGSAEGAVAGLGLAAVGGGAAAPAAVRVGAAHGSWRYFVETESGSSAMDMLDKGFDPATVKELAPLAGLMKGTLEMASFSVLTAPFKRGLIKQVLGSKSVQKAMAKWYVQYLASIGAETTTELAQTRIEQVVNNFAAQIDNKPELLINSADAKKELWETFVKTVMATGVLAAPGAALDLHSEKKAEKKAAAEAAKKAASEKAVVEEPAAPKQLEGPKVEAPAAEVSREQAVADMQEAVDALKDGTGSIEAVEQAVTAFHGTPHDVVRFSEDAIGTGEGAQSFGWGLYFADKPAVADFYRKKLAGSVVGVPFDLVREYFTPGRIIDGYGGKDRVVSFHEGEGGTPWHVVVERVRKANAWQAERYGVEVGSWLAVEEPRAHATQPDAAQIERALGKQVGNLYQVKLPPETSFLNLDKPLSGQSEFVRNALGAAGLRPPEGKDPSGAEIYDHLVDLYRGGKGPDDAGQLKHDWAGAKKAASKFLLAQGIVGAKYLDASSRGAKEGASNYVVYDAGKTEIVREASPLHEAVEKGTPEQAAQALVLFDERHVEPVTTLDEGGTDLGPPGTPVNATRSLSPAGEHVPPIWVSELDKFLPLPILATKNAVYGGYKALRDVMSAKYGASYAAFNAKLMEFGRAAQDSRKRGLGDIIAPQMKEVFNALSAETPEAETAAYAKLTAEERQFVDFSRAFLDRAYEYLSTVEGMTSRFFPGGDKGYFPHMRKSISEILRESPDKGVGATLNSIVEHFTNPKGELSIRDPLTGEIIDKRKFFKNALFRSGELDPSQNVIQVLDTYARALSRKQAIDEMLPTLDTMIREFTARTDQRSPAIQQANVALEEFVTKLLNKEKGQSVLEDVIPTGGAIDTSLRVVQSAVPLFWIAGNFGRQGVSIIGEALGANLAVGPKGLAHGEMRFMSAEGRAILDKYFQVAGKSPLALMREPGRTAAQNARTGMMSVIAWASTHVKQIAFLSYLTDAELKTGEVSDARIAEIVQDLGQVVPMHGDKSIFGQSAPGELLSQFKGWAVPQAFTISRDLKALGKVIADRVTGDGEQKLSPVEARRLTNLAFGAAMAALGLAALGSSDDNPDEGPAARKARQELFSYLTVFDPSFYLRAPAALDWAMGIAKALHMVGAMEEYKRSNRKRGIKKGDLKGPAALLRSVTPSFLREPKSTKPRHKRR